MTISFPLPDMLDYITTLAAEHGFEACGIARVEPLDHDYRRLTAWLAAGHHGTMDYMERHGELRRDARHLLPDARSAIVVLMNYFPAERQPAGQPTIATYAYGYDYHYIIRSRLTRMAQTIAARTPHHYAVYCDSAPVMERTWAVRAGLGWIGRSGMLVNPRLGTYTLIGIIFTSLHLPSAIPMPDRCGHCRRCLDACPTGAITDHRLVDASRCISYLTIEHRGEWHPSLAQQAGHRLYGCDSCMAACPWNRFAHPTTIDELRPIAGIFDIDWTQITRGDFKRLLGKSAMQRAGYRKIKDRAEYIARESLEQTTSE